MKKRRFIVFLIITLTIFTIANLGIYLMNSKENVSVVNEEKVSIVNNEEKVSIAKKEEEEEKQDVLTFKEYQKFYDYLSENIKLKNFEKKYASNHDQINIINPLWTFNTRKHLLLTNENIVRPTEEYMILENENSTCQITIAVCYNKYYIGNNLHTLTSPNTDLKSINQELTTNTTSAVMSYNNILLCIQIGRSKVEGHIMDDVLTEVTTKTMEYFK